LQIVTYLLNIELYPDATINLLEFLFFH
jgi:hypothetical protein